MKHNEPPWTDKQAGPYLDRDKIDKLYEEFGKLAKKLFGVDEDGDLPLDIRLIDRTRYGRMHFRPIPYDHKVVTDAERKDVLGALMCNLAIASEEITRWHRCLEHNPRPAAATDENLASENLALIERNATVENELNVMRREHAVQIRQDEAVKSARAQRNAMEDALHHLLSCKVKSCDECETHRIRCRIEDPKSRKKPGKKS